jgi:6-pyruvoyl-tetrahydropterin synthase
VSGVFAVEVSDHIMIAHSFKGEVFGPAQAVHGATFVVTVTLIADDLDKNGIVVDIGRATDVLKAILSEINYKNLDDLPQFKGKNTTTEFLTKYVFDKVASQIKADRLGRSGKDIFSMRVTIAESPNASAWYEAPVW